jgi:Asp-tRNA(Asn)/Glu-tRNA(Gln) amidotransferase A subunit family amidase
MLVARVARPVALLVVALFALAGAQDAVAAAPVLDLENMSIAKAQSMMASGQLTAVQLTQAYINRIRALNQLGPSLNAVRVLNPNALNDAAQLDAERAQGHIRGVLEGVPVIVKDNIDVAHLPTTAGDIALEHNIPSQDSPIVANMRAAGAIILGKANLAEFAFFLSNTPPNGYGGTEGQVLNGYEASLNPGGSSSGSGAITASGMALATLGSDTGGSIINPAAAQGVVGFRPTMGLLSRSGIVPISASQDTAGPIVQNVADAAAMLQATAGPDPTDAPAGYFGSGIDSDFIVLRSPFTPNYMSALRTDALQGKRIGVITNSDPNYQAAIQEIQHLGATAVPIATPTAANAPAVLTYEFERDLNNYLARVAGEPGSSAPIHSLDDIIAFNNADPRDTIKYGQTSLTSSAAVDHAEGSADTTAYKTNLVQGKINTRKAIDDALNNNSIDATMTPAQTLTGTNSRGGYTQVTIPAGYSPVNRRPVNISFNASAYAESKLLGFAYAYEQGTRDPSYTPVVAGSPMRLERQPASVINPAMYRCAPTVPASMFASRGSCPPGPELLDQIGGTPPALGFSLEDKTASQLEAMIRAHTLTSVDLTKAYMARIAVTNAAGTSINAVRAMNPSALLEAAAADQDVAAGNFRGPLHGLPVLVSDNLDVLGMPTTAGSVALQHSLPSADSQVVAKLKAAGAVILGKANVTEFGGALSSDMPQSYSSLGGQVLNPYDLQVNPGGASAGANSATAAGLAAAAIGTESGSGGLVTPAATQGNVALRPTIGLVSRAGELPFGLSQDTPGPIGRTVRDVASELDAIAGPDPADPATVGQPPVPEYLNGLAPSALTGKRIGVIASTDPNYAGAIAAIQSAGATPVTVTAPGAVATPTVLGYEFKRDLNAYLGGLPSNAPRHSLSDILSYDDAFATEAKKYGQGTAIASQALDTSPGSSDTTTHDTNLAAGRAASRAAIDNLLTANNLNALMTPSATLTTIASRAGYPQLIVPVGYNDLNPASQTRNPVAVSFVGTAFKEQSLLEYGYAMEQTLPPTQTRRPPSMTNVSTWHCTPGNAYTPVVPAPSTCPPGELGTLPPPVPVAASAGGSVPATLELSLSSPAVSFGAFVAGQSADYTTSVGVLATSTGGDATLSAVDPSATATGRLVNGAFSLASPLQVRATDATHPSTSYAPLSASTSSPIGLLSYAAPVTREPVTVGFKQPISDTETLRTGTYSKTVLITLSTMTP